MVFFVIIVLGNISIGFADRFIFSTLLLISNRLFPFIEDVRKDVFLYVLCAFILCTFTKKYLHKSRYFLNSTCEVLTKVSHLDLYYPNCFLL